MTIMECLVCDKKTMSIQLRIYEQKKTNNKYGEQGRLIQILIHESVVTTDKPPSNTIKYKSEIIIPNEYQKTSFDWY